MGACVGVGGCVEVGTGVWDGVGDCAGRTCTTAWAVGAFVGVGSGAFRATLAGAGGAGRGVSVGTGTGAPVWSSPQAAMATMMIAVNARATGLTCASPFSCGAGRPPSPHLLLSRASLPRSLRKMLRSIPLTGRAGWQFPALGRLRSQEFSLRVRGWLGNA